MSRFYTQDQLEDFMRQSNAVEGETLWPTNPHSSGICGRLNPGDLQAAMLVVGMAEKNEKFTHESLCAIHRIAFEHRKEHWVGDYRRCNVRVGPYTPPDWTRVRALMTDYLKRLPGLDAWEAHNQFEVIHPHQDGNGRMGRLIWLYKARQAQLRLTLPFLQLYYYQTLDHYERGKKLWKKDRRA